MSTSVHPSTSSAPSRHSRIEPSTSSASITLANNVDFGDFKKLHISDNSSTTATDFAQVSDPKRASLLPSSSSFCTVAEDLPLHTIGPVSTDEDFPLSPPSETPSDSSAPASILQGETNESSSGEDCETESTKQQKKDPTNSHKPPSGTSVKEKKAMSPEELVHPMGTENKANVPPLGEKAPSTENSLETTSTLPEAALLSDLSRVNTPESISNEDNSSSSDIVAAPGFQYHHVLQEKKKQEEEQLKRRSVSASEALQQFRNASTPDLLNASPRRIDRHLTPSATFARSTIPRPHSAYSLAMPDVGPRGSSPVTFGTSPRRTPEMRPASYIDLLNAPYPQPAPELIQFDAPVPGTSATHLISHKTLEMYRQNVKKTPDVSMQYSFAVFLVHTAQNQAEVVENPALSSQIDTSELSSPAALISEARQLLQKLSSSSYPFAQYYLADGYASGLFNKGKEDYNQAFPLFVLAAKHGHAESAYRAALCYEHAWGTRKDPIKSTQFLRIAATKKHPGAMARLGTACLSGDLGERKYREGIKWLRLATETADSIYPAAPYYLGRLYETGDGEDIFRDETYAAELFTQAAELGYPEANFRMGDAYEHGKLNCPKDPALSVHFYTEAAEKNHPGAMMGLCAWYMVGAEPVLEKDDEEAFEWAKKAAELGFVKAQYAVGFFTEMGIGCRRDMLEANVWYVKAADAGDERAKQRIATINAAIQGGKSKNSTKNKGKKEDSCVIM